MEILGIFVLVAAVLVCVRKCFICNGLPSFGATFLGFFCTLVLPGMFFLAVNDRAYITDLWVCSLGIMCFALGTWSATPDRAEYGRLTRKYQALEWESGSAGLLDWYSVIFIWLGAAALCYLYFSGAEARTIAEIAGGSRLESGSGRGILIVALTVIMPYASLNALALSAGTLKGRSQTLVLNTAVWLIGILPSIIAGYRAPALGFLLMAGLLRVYRKGRVSALEIIFIVMVVVLVFLGLSYVNIILLQGHHEQELVDVWRHRFFLENARNISYIIDLIPSRYEYFYGGTVLMDLKSAMPGPGIGFGGWLMGSVGGRTFYGTGQLTPTIIGEFYANGGVGLVLMGMTVYGLFLQSAYIRYLRSSRGQRGDLASVVFLCFVAANVAILGLVNAIITRVLVVGVMVGAVKSARAVLGLKPGKKRPPGVSLTRGPPVW